MILCDDAAERGTLCLGTVRTGVKRSHGVMRSSAAEHIQATTSYDPRCDLT